MHVYIFVSTCVRAYVYLCAGECVRVCIGMCACVVVLECDVGASAARHDCHSLRHPLLMNVGSE